MESSIKRYEVYKDSGVAWLGEIPDHWNLVPGLTLVSERNEKNKNLKENTVLSLSYGKIIIKAAENLTGLVPESFETYQLAYPGDIIIRPTDLQNDKTSLRTGLVMHKGIISSAYVNLRVKASISASYIHYFLHLVDISKVIYGLGSGLRQNISFQDFRRFNFLFPPLPEQTAIANLLDKKCEKIDFAISQKEKLIDLLKERKHILIQNAVTKGLDSSVEMKDSEVKWIGVIPEHWGIESFKNILIERNKKNDPIKSKERLSLSIDKGITLYSEKTTNLDRFKDDFTQYKLAYKNDLVFNSMNMIVGAVGVSDYFGCVSPVYYTYYARIDNPKITKYYEYFFKNKIVRSQLYCLGKGIIAIDRGEGKFNTVRLKVSRDGLRSMKVPYPSIAEINQIVDFIEEKNSETDKAVNLQEQQIEKLKEYKSTLINSAVTGKIKVV